ncbi:hypothetical protein QM467_01950 [Rhodoblastus sp. 17X3]|uniref:hypothetical protein n=1 Tax=Rhodoblastus sp. 17X3 TaxID=3047026 RepID=UPI0024B7ADA5|nr:hypothetical protein [Rhodoblastus sp. 17X3]MDI9846816.1 hypothetical protein [Rhodoblastus sp. 17X3]
MRRRLLLAASLAAALAACGSAALAGEAALDGVKDIILHAEDGKALTVGTVTFTPDGESSRFKIDFDEAKFTQYFLSMREFKCVEGPEILCHVPYPYPNPRVVTARDLSWLEHDLLFVYKRPADYGAKMAHGLVYSLTMTSDGFIGTPQLIDLDEIASPPADLGAAFFTGEHRYSIQPASRWFDSLTIEPHR